MTRWGSPVGPVGPEPTEPAAPVVPLRGPFPEAGQGPAPLDHHEKMRIRAAAYRATKIYPGPVGELVSRELLSWADLGYRFGGHGSVAALIDHVLKQEPPKAGVAA